MRGEFTAAVVKHLCTWLNVSLDHGPADFARGQGAAECIWVAGSRILSLFCARHGPFDGTTTSSPHVGFSEKHPIPICRTIPPRSVFFSVVPREHNWIRLPEPLMESNSGEGSTAFFAAERQQQQSFLEVRRALEQAGGKKSESGNG